MIQSNETEIYFSMFISLKDLHMLQTCSYYAGTIGSNPSVTAKCGIASPRVMAIRKRQLISYSVGQIYDSY